jgi:deoxyuridine 5'-triphosphate nucleotidohydrolase
MKRPKIRGPLLEVVLSYDAPWLEPKRAYETDTGLDLKASVDMWIPAGGWGVVPTGVRIALMTGEEAPLDIQVRGRSGLASRGILAHVGTVDAGYRGEIKLILFNSREEDFKVTAGDRVGQIIMPPITSSLGVHPDGHVVTIPVTYYSLPVDQVDAVADYLAREKSKRSERGVAGLGSTGGFGTGGGGGAN